MVLTRINFDCLEPLRVRQWVIEDIGIRDEPCVAVTEILFGFAVQTAIGCPTVAQLTLFPRWSRSIWITAWEQRKLGELGSVAMCKRIFKEQTTEQGDVPFYKIGTFGGTPDAFISRELFNEYQRLYQFPKVGDILISAAGTIGRTIVYQGDPAYYQDSNIVWLQHDERLDNGFLLQFLNGKSWSSLEGSTLKRLYNKDLLNAEIAIPSPDEQHQIGSTFARLDDTITLHQRKCQYRGLYGYLSWEQRKLGDLISVYIAHAGPEEDVTVLTSSRDGIQKQEDHFGRLQQHDTSDWNLIPYGYCTYRNRSDDGLFTFNVNKVADRGIVSKFYPVFETPECDADFLVAYLNSSQEIRKKLFVLAVGTSQVVLSYGALKELSLLLPQNREQSAIANVLNHIDNLITLHQ